MALLKYFKTSLPTPKETGIGEVATRAANSAVSKVLAKQLQPGVLGEKRKRKDYGVFTDEQRAAIGRYASEHGNNAAVKKFKGEFEGCLGESTVRLFKKRNLAELKKAKASVLCS